MLWQLDVILTKFSSLAAPEVAKMTTSGAARDENFIKMTFPIECINMVDLLETHYNISL